MIKYTVKRFLFIIPMLLAVICLVFFLSSLMPGTPGRTILGLAASEEAVEAMNEELGYNQPVIKRLLDYLGNVFLRFDFGKSYKTGESVVKTIMTKFPYTLRLTVWCTLVSTLIGIPLGLYSAIRQYTMADYAIRVTAITLNSMPGFWLSMLAILLFSLQLGWLPPDGVDSWKSYVMPVTINGLTTGAALIRMTRTIMLETIREDYVRTARAKGCSERTVNWKHAFANAALPIVTSVGLSFASMLGGTVVVENVFSIPGLGTVAMSAVNNKDIPVMMGCTIFFAALFSVFVVLIDLVSAWMDPRVRAKFTGK